MPCYPFTTPQGATGIICGKLGPRCSVCGGVAAFLCDFPVRRGGTCDLRLCVEHALEIAEDHHFCPGHHKVWAEFRDPDSVAAHLANIVPYRRPTRER